MQIDHKVRDYQLDAPLTFETPKRRTIRNALIASIVLAVLLVGGGMAYALLMNYQTPSPTVAAPTPVASQELTPHAPNPNAPEGVAIDGLLSPVTSGDNGSVIAQTLPTSTCKITIDSTTTAGSKVVLPTKTADAYGSVQWTWPIDETTTHGNHSVTITCVYHGRTGVVQGNFVVQ